MSKPGFDREWHLDDLLDRVALERIGLALSSLLDGELAILCENGELLWGVLSPEARREPVVLELEPVAYLASASAKPAALSGARVLLQMLLRTQTRYKMAANLHLEAVAEDFETLRLEHARLQESETRYRTLAGELEARVRTQVAQLEERQQMLYQAEKLASVGQLAAGVAHEVNNPLGFVRSNLSSFNRYLSKFTELKQLLENSACDYQPLWQSLDLDFVLEDAVDLLAESIKGLDRIARIVSQLRDFSQVDRAAVVLANINDCLQEVADTMLGLLPSGITLKLDLQALPDLVCLPGHLNQVFMNLILNASHALVDAGRKGEIGISSQLLNQEIVVQVRDQGVGMTPEQMARAFEPFYTTRDVGAGTGLGLATARNIVQGHSGQISLESQPGIGTTVTLRIPLSK